MSIISRSDNVLTLSDFHPGCVSGQGPSGPSQSVIYFLKRMTNSYLIVSVGWGVLILKSNGNIYAASSNFFTQKEIWKNLETLAWEGWDSRTVPFSADVTESRSWFFLVKLLKITNISHQLLSLRREFNNPSHGNFLLRGGYPPFR